VAFLLFTSISLVDVISARNLTLSLTPVFTVPINSAEIYGHLPYLALACSFCFLHSFCYCFRCAVRILLMHGSHQMFCLPQNNYGFFLDLSPWLQMRHMRPPHSSWKLRRNRQRSLSQTCRKGLRRKLVHRAMAILTVRDDLRILKTARQPLTTLSA
jgi:hypothetical protein